VLPARRATDRAASGLAGVSSPGIGAVSGVGRGPAHTDFAGLAGVQAGFDL